MKGDFTRRTFRHRDHYRAVLLQQGRVALDADWNEQVEIQDHLDETTTLDTIGRHGAPAGAAGMEIVSATGDITAGGCRAADLRISPGRYYVDGILCENDEPVPLATQPDLAGVSLPDRQGRYIAYLDVWAEHVTVLERPELREVALGGPDTATRSRTIWQVRLVRPQQLPQGCPAEDPPFTPSLALQLPGGTPSRLRARAKAPVNEPGPCVLPPTARYRRLENQLYRVEIRTGSGPGRTPTYMWSRENGSVAARLLTMTGNVLTIDAPGRDERLGFARNNWVEVTDTARVRRGQSGFLAQLDEVLGTKLTARRWLDGQPVDGELTAGRVVRRWDSDGQLDVGAGWVGLEGGVEIEFDAGGTYRTGDYWLIPARSASLTGEPVDPDLAGNVEWPRDGNQPAFRPPVGIAHHYAPVALIELDGTGWRRLADCRRVFSPLGGLVDVEYAGGDGQETLPGAPLPQPLEISVSAGTGPVGGAVIHFAADDADGRLAATPGDLSGSTASAIDIATDQNGLARCFWRPAGDPSRPSQRVTALLTGATGPASPVHFSASLSIADRVGYDPGACTALAGVDTVQGALDRLVGAWSLAEVGGNGQAGPPGGELPLPAEVLVRSDCGPVVGAQVRFTVTSGAVAVGASGLAAGAPSVDIPTGTDGLARCSWRLGPDDPVQALAVELLPGTAPVSVPTRLSFTASLERGRDDAAGLHVTDVVLVGGQQPLVNDSLVAASSLSGGVGIVLDGSPLAATVTGKPVLTLTVALPYPFSQSDRDLWHPGVPPAPETVIGATPLVLAGEVTLGSVGNAAAVTWSPTKGSSDFLSRLLTMMAEFGRGDKALCHLTLTGRAITDSAAADRRVVNGLALGRPGPGGLTEMVLPTVDDVHGADFTMWFWLVESVVNLVLLPTAGGLFRLKAVRDTLGFVLPRDELRSRLRAGVQINDGPAQDLDAAKRVARRGFHDGRHLVVVVDERYEDAAAVLHDALEKVPVELEMHSTKDPAGVARARTTAGQQLDGVLTDDDSALPVTDRGDFGKAIPL